MKTGELEAKKERNYSKEHARRKAKKSRLLADIDKDKAENFLALLSEKGLTFTNWINKQIDNEFKS